SPFNVNVTTSYSGPFNDRVAVHHVLGGQSTLVSGASGALGISFVGSFRMGGAGNKVSFTFAQDPAFGTLTNPTSASSATIMATARVQGNTAAHEVGHQMGLEHFGGNNSQPLGIMQTPSPGIAPAYWRRGNTSDAAGEPPVMLQDDMGVISGSA